VNRLTRVLVATASVALSVTLVVGHAPAAEAITIPTPAIVGAGSLDAAGLVEGAGFGAEGAELIGGACATGVGCLVAGGVMLGVGLYMTRNTWLPYVSGLFNGGGHTTSGPPSNSLTVIDMAPVIGSPNMLQADMIVVVGGLTFGRGMTPQIQYRTAGTKCQTSDGQILTEDTSINISGAGAVTGVQTGPQSSQWNLHGTWLICPAGSRIIQLTNLGVRAVDTSQNIYTGQVQNLYFPQEPALQTIVSTADCLDPAGEVQHASASITDQTAGRLPVPSCESHGWRPTGMSATNADTGQLLGQWALDDPSHDYADCFVGAQVVCKATVWVNGKSCTSAQAAFHCVDWFHYKETHPSNVECRFGSYVVDYDVCAPLRQAFPSPGVTIEVSPGEDGGWYPDPGHTGNPAPAPDPDPGPDPDPDPDPTGDPDPTTGPSDGSDPFPTTGTQPDPGDGSDGCLGGSWGLNPVEWVYRPVKCAVVWAFVPQTSLQTRVTTLQTAITGRVPFAWFGPIFALPGDLPDGSCPDWRIKVKSLDQNVVCDSAFTGAVRTARPFLTAAMLALAFTPLLRGLMYASIPLLKPTPTDGK
jgi:hypothetical protein